MKSICRHQLTDLWFDLTPAGGQLVCGHETYATIDLSLLFHHPVIIHSGYQAQTVLHHFTRCTVECWVLTVNVH